MPTIPDLYAAVWSLLDQIPAGRVSTYGGVARALGDVAASRFVGHLMLHHDHSGDCKCHRLVRSDGTLGKHVSGVHEKRSLLEADAIHVRHGRDGSDGCIDLDAIGWNDFVSDHPLKSLAEFQRFVSGQLTSRSGTELTTTEWCGCVGGVDVSFVPNSDLAVAAFVEVDLKRGELVYQRVVAAPVRFPYISGYLAFRELPVLTKLIACVRAERDLPLVTIVDGSGILHPRMAGVASMLGYDSKLTTIGVTKKHLAGTVDRNRMRPGDSRPVVMDGEVRGYALLPGSGTDKPLYVSPGTGIDPRTALDVITQCLLGRRLPEPIYWADRISRSHARQLATDAANA